ncbi:amidohydrolase family protein [Natronorarus salvus]|uniref:amidohydrolase family protein n=1 Tax=Natronorarus salvus TaxID=3117733 RepID=UPI002F2667E4
MTMDLAITGALVVTMDESRGGLGIVDDGTVGVRDGEIVAVGSGPEIDASDANRVIDASGRALLPGFVNAHTHTTHTLVRGGAQDVPEIEWMNGALGPIARQMTSEDEVVGSRLGVCEALLSGVTTFGEYTSGVGRLVEEVYRPLGVRVAATETINEVREEREGLGPCEPYPFERSKGERDLDRAEALFEEYGAEALVTPVYGPQALDMISPGLLEEISARADERDASIHMHVAQGEREHLQIEARYGAGESTVSALSDLGLLDERLIAVHCHGATPAERERLAEAGARYIGCPSSIAAIDGITPPVAEFLSNDAPVGIGTDQAPGPGGHSFLRELRTSSLLAKTDSSDPTALPAWTALRVGTIGGARALGLGDEIGTIEEGKRADLVLFDLGRLSVAPTVDRPLHTAIPNLLYAGGGSAVETVLVDGEVVVEEGSVVGVDEAELVAEATERAERVFAGAEADWRAAGSALVSASDEGRL